MCRSVWRVISLETCSNNKPANTAIEVLINKSAGDNNSARAASAAAQLNRFYIDVNYAYQPGRSTSDAVRDVTARVLQRLEDGRQVAAIFCDLSRAFETIDHALLLSKLRHYGFTGCFHGTIASILIQGADLWATSADRDRPFKLQKRALRTIARVPPDHPARDLFRRYKILTLPSVYILTACRYYLNLNLKWRCTNRNLNCKAYVVTKDNLVVRRMFNHIHSFHDKKILRMVAAGNVLAALPEDCKQDTNEESSKNPVARKEKLSKKSKKTVAKKTKGQKDLIDMFERARDKTERAIEEKSPKKSTRTKKPYRCKQSADAQQKPYAQGNLSIDTKTFKQIKKIAEPKPIEQGDHSSAAKVSYEQGKRGINKIFRIPSEHGIVAKIPCDEDRAVAERLCELSGQKDILQKIFVVT
ncbi:uncharacterized protein LOC125225341 [Leguminivora glycinivorella]|uniref:uncharacterized protein LOC125225341 n=1 Tax=Leguminivora glycinivorella TaxID=1035111 RepID=UPI00200E7BE6|nr:uncharacterized protein LOC125225341 [Leguminivora glycinivorella]